MSRRALLRRRCHIRSPSHGHGVVVCARNNRTDINVGQQRVLPQHCGAVVAHVQGTAVVLPATKVIVADVRHATVWALRCARGRLAPLRHGTHHAAALGAKLGVLPVGKPALRAQLVGLGRLLGLARGLLRRLALRRFFSAALGLFALTQLLLLTLPLLGLLALASLLLQPPDFLSLGLLASPPPFGRSSALLLLFRHDTCAPRTLFDLGNFALSRLTRPLQAKRFFRVVFRLGGGRIGLALLPARRRLPLPRAFG